MAQKKIFTEFVASIVELFLSVIAAATTALLLALIARDNIGMPPDMVREDALIAASVIIAGVAVCPRAGGDGGSCWQHSADWS